MPKTGTGAATLGSVALKNPFAVCDAGSVPADAVVYRVSNDATLRRLILRTFLLSAGGLHRVAALLPSAGSDGFVLFPIRPRPARARLAFSMVRLRASIFGRLCPLTFFLARTLSHALHRRSGAPVL